MSWEDVRNMQLSFIKQIISIFPSWTIDDVLETDVRRLHEVMFFDQKQLPTQEKKIVSMEDWFQEIGR